MLSASTFSPTSIATVHKWVQNCTSKHVHCGSSHPQQLPTRVIDVGQRQCSNIKLYESGGEMGSYACLSHCWGLRGPCIQMTSKTIKEYKRNIPWTLLPATFRHAVTVVRLLGLRYLWIDCLCIYSHRTTMNYFKSLRFVPQFFEGFNFTHLASQIWQYIRLRVSPTPNQSLRFAGGEKGDSLAASQPLSAICPGA
jgi:hypothetical protein